MGSRSVGAKHLDRRWECEMARWLATRAVDVVVRHPVRTATDRVWERRGRPAIQSPPRSAGPIELAEIWLSRSPGRGTTLTCFAGGDSEHDADGQLGADLLIDSTSADGYWVAPTIVTPQNRARPWRASREVRCGPAGRCGQSGGGRSCAVEVVDGVGPGTSASRAWSSASSSSTRTTHGPNLVLATSDSRWPPRNRARSRIRSRRSTNSRSASAWCDRQHRQSDRAMETARRA